MKVTRVPITHFAAAERVPVEMIRRQAAAFNAPPIDLRVLESVLNYVFIINQQRQIVFASRNVRELMEVKGRRQPLGRRLGEVLGCIHASECPGGCGTSDSCQYCGAIQAMLTSLGGRADLREFRLTRVLGCGQAAREFLVLATPLVQDEAVFSLLAVTDRSDAKARRAMKELFAQQAHRPGQFKRQAKVIRKPSAERKPPGSDTPTMGSRR